ncbi:hypothetical protein ACFRMN_15975 [Streptomyces sp. NPDC056835]
MKLFVTGATGHIGSVVSDRLRVDGYVLTGPARSEELAAQLVACLKGMTR